MGKFLTDLSFLDDGNIFPPTSELERLTDYRDNIQLFNGETYDVFRHYYPDANRRIMRILDDYADMISYPVDINYHRILATGVQDLVCGEKPIITVPSIKQDALQYVLDESRFYERLAELALDMPRFGASAARAYKFKDGHPRMQIVPLSNLYKVVSQEDKNEVINFVLAEPRETKSKSEGKNQWELFVQIHFKGYYINRRYRIEPIAQSSVITSEKRLLTNLQRFEIKRQIGEDAVIPTGLDDFAIVAAHNLMTSDTCWGHDEYQPMDPILAEIWARLGQIAIILDKHARPDFYADICCFSQDDRTGQWSLKTGMGRGFPIPSGGTPPQYLTWDGQLTACFTELDRLFEQLYKITEMGPIFEAASGTSNVAYETIKAQMARPLAKAARISRALTDPLRKMISLLSEYCGSKIEMRDISIEWQDGLPNDEKQEIEKADMKIRAGLSSPLRENMARFGKSRESAEEIEEEVNDYQAASAARTFGGYGASGIGNDG